MRRVVVSLHGGLPAHGDRRAGRVFAGIVAPLVLQNAWALVLLPLGLAAVMGLGGCFPLRPMAAEAIEPARARARRATTWMIGLTAALVVWRLLHQYWRG